MKISLFPENLIRQIGDFAASHSLPDDPTVFVGDARNLEPPGTTGQGCGSRGGGRMPNSHDASVSRLLLFGATKCLEIELEAAVGFPVRG